MMIQATFSLEEEELEEEPEEDEDEALEVSEDFFSAGFADESPLLVAEPPFSLAAVAGATEEPLRLSVR
jgi:hypothetical protein